MQKQHTRTYEVTVRPCSAEPHRYRYDLISSDRAHRISSASNFASEAMALEVGEVHARAMAAAANT